MSASTKAIRIVIPAYNSGATIRKCVTAILASVDLPHPPEIVVVDNGKNSEIENLLREFPITLIKRQKSQGAAYARNEGAKDFLNGILVFIDSDVICEKKCIKELIAPLQQHLCDATIGNYSQNIEGLSFSQSYKQLYINHIYGRKGLSIKNDYWTAICAVDAQVFHKLNGFNTNYKKSNGEDQEFGFRLTKNGYHVMPVNHANGQHHNSYGILNIFKNDYKKGHIAVVNSLENQISLSDNRHSKKQDIIAVLFANLAFISLLFIPIHFSFIISYGLFFSLWFMFRFSLSKVFFKYGGVLFFMKAIFFMYCLDLIRCLCVITGVLDAKLINKYSTRRNKQFQYH